MRFLILPRVNTVLGKVGYSLVAVDRDCPQQQFLFMFDADLRRTVLKDFDELERLHQSGCWKSVVILAGAVVETVLVDALRTSSGAEHRDPLQMTLEELIRTSKDARLLDPETVHLASALRGFRNLVHGARAKKGKTEQPGPRQAALARQTVLEVARDLERFSSRGPSADKLLQALESGRDRIHVLDELVAAMSPEQQVRLLTSVLPHRYYLESDAYRRSSTLLVLASVLRPVDKALKQLLVRAYRTVFDKASTVVKECVLAHFAGLIKSGDMRYLKTLDNAFILDSDLEHMREEDRSLARKWLASRGRVPAATT